MGYYEPVSYTHLDVYKRQHFVKRQSKTLCFYTDFDDSTIMKTEWYVVINSLFYIHNHLRISININ